MKTYQDLLAAGPLEKDRMDFIRAAVACHRTSPLYRAARDAEAYYARHNVTIEKFQKFLYNVQGRVVPDLFSANYKLKTGFFRRFVIQQTQYVLSNGVSFTDPATKKRLGSDFDFALQSAAAKALIAGVSFGFWNYDHLEVFQLADTDSEPGFAPLYDENSGLLCAGIRYWNGPAPGIHRATLYEPDGYTDYIRRPDCPMEVLFPKRAYIQRVSAAPIGGIDAVESVNYDALPILPLYANDLHQSELIGLRESIDCYDFIKSGMANDIDDTSGFYWTLKNAGGMDDMDLQRFVERMKMVRATVLEDGVDAQAHTIDLPVQARTALLDRLRADLYEDAMLTDVDKALSGQQTATAIRLAYQAQDDKCAVFEFCLRDFLARLLKLLGTADEPSFRWNRIANQADETAMVLSAAPYLDRRAVLEHLPWLTPEETDDILRRSGPAPLPTPGE